MHRVLVLHEKYSDTIFHPDWTMRKSVIRNQFAYEIKKPGFAGPENKYKVRENIFTEAKKRNITQLG